MTSEKIKGLAYSITEQGEIIEHRTCGSHDDLYIEITPSVGKMYSLTRAERRDNGIWTWKGGDNKTHTFYTSHETAVQIAIAIRKDNIDRLKRKMKTHKLAIQKLSELAGAKKPTRAKNLAINNEG